MSINKITNKLKSYLENNQPLHDIEVVIELTPILKSMGLPPVSRSEKISLHKKNFMEELEPVAKLISNHGGDILGSAWLNQTVKAKIPAKSIKELARLKEVTTIDLPNSLMKD